MKVVVYARVACPDQLSLDCQVESLMRYAEAHGYEVTETIAENGVSGFQNDAGLDMMLRLAQEGRIEAVLCREPSRISRDYERVDFTHMALRKHGVAVKYLPPYDREVENESFNDLITALRKYLENSE